MSGGVSVSGAVVAVVIHLPYIDRDHFDIHQYNGQM
jgi:hypothetical protein